MNSISLLQIKENTIYSLSKERILIQNRIACIKKMKEKRKNEHFLVGVALMMQLVLNEGKLILIEERISSLIAKSFTENS